MNTNTNITTLGLSGITIAGSTTVTGFEGTKAVGTGLTLGTDILAELWDCLWVHTSTKARPQTLTIKKESLYFVFPIYLLTFANK